ncbi:probable glycerol-3-phosphate acyltransferase 3 [Miscanthus floridulus]|uniref:probable glycerol-3-phosphate acyltransferase 3 n=1 Tax=Miscanthus floridulus TaxID=154761 RepID=UPI00345A42BE
MAKKRLLLAHKLFSAMLSLLLHGRRPPPHYSGRSSTPPVVHRGAGPPTLDARTTTAALVVDVDTALLRSGDLFPYFMLVALEAGGFLRGLLLLLLCPLIRLLMPRGAAVRAMAAVSFCGLRAGQFRAGRAVLPKWLMEDVAAEAFEAVRAAGIRAVCVTALPRVMVDGFLREYLGVEAVVAREMKVMWGFYTGLMEELPEGAGEMVMKAVVAAPAPAAEEESDKAVVGFSGSMEFLNHPLARCCKVLKLCGVASILDWQPFEEDMNCSYVLLVAPTIDMEALNATFVPKS